MKKSITFFLLIGGALLAQPEGHDHMGHLQQLDADGNGEITQAEFLAGAEKHFAAMDADGDGLLTGEEIGGLRHARRAERTHKRIGSHILLRGDGDEDGIVSLTEWNDFVAGLETDEDGAIVLGERRRRAHHGDRAMGNPLDFNGNEIIDADDLGQLFAKFDTNGDQVLDDTELVRRKFRRHGGKDDGAKRRSHH